MNKDERIIVSEILGTLPFADVRALRDEAGQANDLDLFDICCNALKGNRKDWHDAAIVIVMNRLDRQDDPKRDAYVLEILVRAWQERFHGE